MFRPLPRLPNIQSEDANSKQDEFQNTRTFRNRLAEQDQSPMNQTYTIDTRRRNEKMIQEKIKRSSSADSELVEFTINGAISGVFPKVRTWKSHCTKSSSASNNRGSAASTGALDRRWTNKLPSLGSTDQDRKCCQRPWTRAQIELQKYKDALKNN